MSIRGAPVKLIGVVAAAVLAVVVLSTAYSTSILLAADDCSDTEADELLLTLHAYPDPEGIRLCWGSNPPEIRGYRIYRGTTEDTIVGHQSGHWHKDYGVDPVVHPIPIPTSWVDQNTTPRQEYWYRIVLLNGHYRDTNGDGVEDHNGDEIARTTNVSMIAPVLGTVTSTPTPTETNTGPEFADETTTRSIVEGSQAGRAIGAPVSATDANAADAGELTYELSGTDESSFDIDATNGQIKTKDPLVYATKSSYTVTVTATDPFGASGTITVTITITQAPSQQSSNNGGGGGRSSGGGGGSSAPPKAANPEPEFDARGPVTITVPENTEAGTAIGDPLTASDDDDTVLTYSIIDWQDGSSFDIDSSTGQLKTKASLDYEARTQYQLQVKVHDDDGGNDRITVKIRVTGVPEAPTVTGDTAISVAENSTGSVATYTATDPEGSDVTWDLSGDDADDFSIANGALSFKAPPDHDNPTDSDDDNVYDVTIEASDGTDTGTLDVVVTVTNLIDDFRVRTSTRGSDTKGVVGSGNSGSGSGSGSAMTLMSYPENSTATVATYAAIENQGEEIEWSVAGDASSLFSIAGGALNFVSSPDYESPADSDTNNDYTVTVQASDGTDTASLDITINVTNVNEGPTVTGDSTPAFAEQGTGSVATYTATDPEGDQLTWSVSGDDADDFSVAAGILNFATAPNFEEPADSDTDNIYAVTVQASDGTYAASLNVSVTVTDIQELTIINSSTQAIGLVSPDSATTIETPDGVASVTFPVASRDKPFMARVDSDMSNCEDESSGDTSDDSADDELRVCLTVDIFDNWGNQEEDVTLDQPASISLTMDAEDLGGVEAVMRAYELGGINIYTRSGADDEWSEVEFTLATDDEGVVTITISGVNSFSEFAAATNAGVFSAVLAPATPEPTPTPTPTPTPRAEPRHQRSLPTSMVAASERLRIPPRPASAAALRPARSTPDDTLPEVQSATQAASASPVLFEVVDKNPLWALIIMILGGLMAVGGGWILAAPHVMAPPRFK